MSARPQDRRARMIRYQGNRMMIELILERQITKEEAIRVYNNSSKEREVGLWGFESSLELTELKIKEFVDCKE